MIPIWELFHGRMSRYRDKKFILRNNLTMKIFYVSCNKFFELFIFKNENFCIKSENLLCKMHVFTISIINYF